MAARTKIEAKPVFSPYLKPRERHCASSCRWHLLARIHQRLCDESNAYKMICTPIDCKLCILSGASGLKLVEGV